MASAQWNLDRDGFCILPRAIAPAMIESLLAAFDHVFDNALNDESAAVRARSSRGHVYAARNLIRSIPEVETVWQVPSLLPFLREVLGEELGLVRALFFDKPPERTWNLPWHKDTSISVKDNSTHSP